MKMRYLAAIAAVSALFAGSAMAQNTMTQGNNDKAASPAQPTKQRTQGVPSSMNNPQYGGPTASKQQSQGVPSALNNQQYGSDWQAKKQQ
ncbi:MAG TPA: hypothetical protein VE690_21180 [Rhodopila sp.]|nr:hypothetical protein [Rhodopila sp.]